MGNTDLICEQCRAESEPSHVTDEGTESTCIGFGPFYDQQGRPHSHDPNNHCNTYSCSRGHRWQQHWKAECPECGKWWLLKKEEPRLLNDYGCQSLVNGDAKMPEPETTVSATETLRAPDWADQIIGGGLTFRQWMSEYGVRVPRCRPTSEER